MSRFLKQHGVTGSAFADDRLEWESGSTAIAVANCQTANSVFARLCGRKPKTQRQKRTDFVAENPAQKQLLCKFSDLLACLNRDHICKIIPLKNTVNLTRALPGIVENDPRSRRSDSLITKNMVKTR